VGINYDVVYGFCRNLSLCRRWHSVRRGDSDYVDFCFSDPAPAAQFRNLWGESCRSRKGRQWRMGVRKRSR
jgi:hypothetical protein